MFSKCIGGMLERERFPTQVGSSIWNAQRSRYWLYVIRIAGIELVLPERGEAILILRCIIAPRVIVVSSRDSEASTHLPRYKGVRGH